MLPSAPYHPASKANFRPKDRFHHFPCRRPYQDRRRSRCRRIGRKEQRHNVPAVRPYPLRSIAYRAGRHREELGDPKLTSWSITGMRDEAPAISEVDVAMEGILNDRPWSGTQVMRLIFNDDKFEMRVRDAPDGSLTVMPNFLPTLQGTAVGSFNAATPSSDAPPTSV